MIARHPADSELDHLQILINRRYFVDALAYGQELQATCEGQVRYHREMSSLFSYLRREVECLHHLNRCVELEPEAPTHRFGRAIWFINRGELRRAIADCDEAIALEARHGTRGYTQSALLLRVFASISLGELEAAESDLGALDEGSGSYFCGRIYEKRDLEELLRQARSGEGGGTGK